MTTSRNEQTRRPLAPPQDFDALTAERTELQRYGLPQRPDPQAQPGLAALWEKQARRYRAYEHLRADARRPERADDIGPRALGLFPRETCGYALTSVAAPFTSLFVTWTVPNLRHSPTPLEPNHFRIFAGLGFLDVHVEMTVDQAENVTSRVTATGAGQVDLPAEPGDVLSAAMCLGTTPPARATYVLANETRSQTVNVSFDSGFPPAVTVNAGISRGVSTHPFNPLARFGTVYFDEISAYTTDGFRSLLGGEAVTMVGDDGSTLARPFRLNDFGFKAVYAGS